MVLVTPTRRLRWMLAMSVMLCRGHRNHDLIYPRATVTSMSRIVEDNPGESRFELRVDGELVGWSEYRPAGDNVIVAHTEIDQRREGEGLGSALVRGALDQIRASGKTVIPTCPFTAAWIRRHPEYAELVDASLRGQFTSSD